MNYYEIYDQEQVLHWVCYASSVFHLLALMKMSLLLKGKFGEDLFCYKMKIKHIKGI